MFGKCMYVFDKNRTVTSVICNMETVQVIFTFTSSKMTSGPLTPETVLYAGKDMKAYICTYTIGLKKCPCINLQY